MEKKIYNIRVVWHDDKKPYTILSPRRKYYIFTLTAYTIIIFLYIFLALHSRIHGIGAILVSSPCTIISSTIPLQFGPFSFPRVRLSPIAVCSVESALAPLEIVLEAIQ